MLYSEGATGNTEKHAKATIAILSCANIFRIFSVHKNRLEIKLKSYCKFFIYLFFPWCQSIFHFRYKQASITCLTWNKSSKDCKLMSIGDEY